MKKFLAILAVAGTLSACHYGTEEAQNTLKDNEKYKSDEAGYSVNRANVTATEEASVDTTVATVDSTTTK
jgi:hypothetical protein